MNRLQYVLPQLWLSRLVGFLARLRLGALTTAVIRWFVGHYGVNMQEAVMPDINAYPSFNEFFTRALKPGVREIQCDERAILSPVDGTISQCGRICQGEIIQAKGQPYSVAALLGDATAALAFEGGFFMTIYLSPKDYHRIHMPMTGKLACMRFVPGRLFSVNPWAVDNVAGVFARNERVVTHFDTAFGGVAQVLVGALFVGSMDTVWAGTINAVHPRKMMAVDYPDQPQYSQGVQMGHFNMGSTVVLLLPNNPYTRMPGLVAGETVRLGQVLLRL